MNESSCHSCYSFQRFGLNTGVENMSLGVEDCMAALADVAAASTVEPAHSTREVQKPSAKPSVLDGWEALIS